VTACCVSKGELRERAGQSLLEAIDGPRMTAIREKLLRGEWPDECGDCAKKEAAGLVSLRQLEKDKRRNRLIEERKASLTSAPAKLEHVELAFDSRCNLKCRMCSPTYSQKWREDLPKFEAAGMTAEFIEPEFPHDGLDPESLLDRLAPTSTVTLKGGEPMLNPALGRLFRGAASRGLLKRMHLIVVTNGTVLSDWFLELHREFEFVNLIVSVDGTDPLFGYIRHGRYTAQDVKKNLALLKMHGFKGRINVTTAVQVYNMLSYAEIVREFRPWAAEFQHTLVTGPESFCVRKAPDFIRLEALQRTRALVEDSTHDEASRRGFATLASAMEQGEFDAVSWQRFQSYTLALDRIRNESIQKAAPELASHFDSLSP
jgi:molybdenum cofactor biosynthesis enzyme MoaA